MLAVGGALLPVSEQLTDNHPRRGSYNMGSSIPASDFKPSSSQSQNKRKANKPPPAGPETSPQDDIRAALRRLRLFDPLGREAEIQRLHQTYRISKGVLRAQLKELEDNAKSDRDTREDNAASLVAAILKNIPCVRGADARVYAAFSGVYIPLDSEKIQQKVASLFYKAHGYDCSPTAIQKPLLRMQHDATDSIVPMRVAYTSNGSIWLDLKNGSFVRIMATGVETQRVSNSPFYRPETMLPLPTPVLPERDSECAAVFNAFGQHLGLERKYMTAVIAWLLSAIRPMQTKSTTRTSMTTYPLLAVVGGQGGGKSSKCADIRNVLDPGTPASETVPETIEAICISGEGQRVLSYDNVSFISDKISDAFCRRATGDGSTKRTAYSNRDRSVFVGSNPIILNTITDGIFQRADLLDRTLIIKMTKMTDDKRMPDEKVVETFEALHPRVLGALCYCASRALKNFAKCKAPGSIRMNSAAQWAIAGAEAAGYSEKEIIDAFLESKAHGVALVMEDPVVQTLINNLSRNSRIPTMNASGWLKRLTNQYCGDNKVDRPLIKSWPQTDRQLRERLDRVEDALRSNGILILRNEGRTNNGYEFTFQRGEVAKSPPAPTSPTK